MNGFSCLILLLLLIHSFLQTSYGQQNKHICAPSACGNIRNISFPFRLEDDPKHCGHPRYQLSCENQTTFIYLDSHKHFVRTINYHNYTIRVSDASVNDNISSFPHYSLQIYYPFSTRSHVKPYNDIAWPITLLSCPFMVNNNSDYVGMDDCVNTSKRCRYIKLGSDVKDMCRIDGILMSSSILVKHKHRNASLLEIHSSLLYGFELSWWSYRNIHICPPNYLRLIPCGGVPVLNIIWRCLQATGVYGGLANLAVRILIVFPCILGLLICKFRRRHLSMFELIEGYLQSTNNLMPIRYSYSQIKKMSRSFSEKLGEGGYGSVYKGKLRSGPDVAVKVLNKPKGNGYDFINEVSTIGRIHHVNVVKLVGYCAERSKCALVYDFMPKGSLEKYIFNQDVSNSLNWEKKYDIAVGVARGIDYLHRGCDIQILHFDIKPHNILLDDNFIPKISDFGLAKFYSIEKNNVTLTAARGTIGYVAPELMNRSIGSVSYKADVYSFGMLLIEMVGLKRNITRDDNKSSQYFPDWIYDSLNQDEDIETGRDDDIGDEDVKKISRKMKIVGLWCIRMSPDDRPSMSEVVKMLVGETENLQIPPMPSESYQVEVTNWEIESTDSIYLLDDDASSDIN